MPGSPSVSQRGYLSFRNKATNAITYAGINATGAATFSAFLFGGSYDVAFTTSSDNALVGMPTGAATSIASSLSLTSTQSFTWNLPVITASGTLTVNGAPMPGSPGVSQRGYLSFRNKTTSGSTYAGISPTGSATFSALLFGGSYDVTFTTSSDSALVGLPIGSASSIASNLSLTSTQSFAWNLPVITASGTLTVNGAQMPGSPSVSQRGYLSFRNKLTGSITYAGIASTGPATLSALLFGGSYDITFTTSSDNALVGMPIGTTTSLAKGCVTSGSCSASAADLTGQWSVVHESGNFGTWALSLTDSAGALSGAYTASSYSGTVAFGTRSGAAFSMTLTAPGCQIEATGTIEDPCRISGVSYCVGFSRSNFIGFR
jgi:hypothetical protein